MFRHDKFAAARELLELFNLQLAKQFQCGYYIVHNETLYPYRGSGFPFRIYIKGMEHQLRQILVINQFFFIAFIFILYL